MGVEVKADHARLSSPLMERRRRLLLSTELVRDLLDLYKLQGYLIRDEDWERVGRVSTMSCTRYVGADGGIKAVVL